MLTIVADFEQLWKVGSTAMSGLHMQMPDGRKITIEVDGTIIREQDEIPVEFCDGCQLHRPTENGKYVANQGLSLIWLCKACK
jgi:hypothetical protein